MSDASVATCLEENAVENPLEECHCRPKCNAVSYNVQTSGK